MSIADRDKQNAVHCHISLNICIYFTIKTSPKFIFLVMARLSDIGHEFQGTNTRIMASSPTWGMDIYLHSVLFWTGSRIAIGLLPAQEIISSPGKIQISDLIMLHDWQTSNNKRQRIRHRRWNYMNFIWKWISMFVRREKFVFLIWKQSRSNTEAPQLSRITMHSMMADYVETCSPLTAHKACYLKSWYCCTVGVKNWK
jgi:hypothetical protein